MVILVSDLHLLDTVDRTPIKTELLIRYLKGTIDRAANQGMEVVHLILLGDIFEILKSKEWLAQGVRPWESSTPKHITTVDSIFEGVAKSNSEFFSGLRDLRSKGTAELNIVYIPGNHDRPINTEMGINARSSLRRLLGIEDNGELFESYFLSEEYELLAKHGHEWDPLNRYGKSTSAIGDAIVIELLLALPLKIIEKLGLESSHPDVAFLFELDNVRPQNPKVLARWVSQGLQKIELRHPTARRAFQQSCEEIMKTFQSIRATSEQQGIQFESFESSTVWISALTKVFARTATTLGVLTAAELLPSIPSNGEILGDLAVNDLSSLSASGLECKYVISGHTHRPVVIPLNMGYGQLQQARLYLNTGTWRSVHAVASTIQGKAAPNYFASWDDQCVISIFSPAEQKSYDLPPYEFRRVSSGLNG